MIGIFFSVAGIIISVASVVALNRNLSAFPTPKQSAELIQSGIYKYMRHPVYSNILFFVFGFSIYSENTLRLLIFFTLLILFRFKAAYEAMEETIQLLETHVYYTSYCKDFLNEGKKKDLKRSVKKEEHKVSETSTLSDLQKNKSDLTGKGI